MVAPLALVYMALQAVLPAPVVLERFRTPRTLDTLFREHQAYRKGNLRARFLSDYIEEDGGRLGYRDWE